MRQPQAPYACEMVGIDIKCSGRIEKQVIGMASEGNLEQHGLMREQAFRGMKGGKKGTLRSTERKCCRSDQPRRIGQVGRHEVGL
jgi:hypothetical protein